MPHALLRRLLAIGLITLAACSKEEAPEAAPSLTVSLASPQQHTVPREVQASGAVAAWEEVTVGVELSGLRVATVAVEVGSQVRKGEVLLRVDDRTMDSQLAQAQASVTEANSVLETAQKKARRIRELANKQMVSLQDAEEAESAATTARARLNTAIASRNAAQVQRDFTVVRAPFDGVISARSVQPGQVVAAGTELLRLIRDGRLEWRAELAENDLLQVQPGTPVKVKSPDGEVDGMVRRVSPALDARNRTGTVYADLPAPGTLRAGMFAQGRIAQGEVSALLIPADAVVRRDGRAYVFTVGSDNRARELGVEIGGSHADQVEVRSGLKASDKVVSRGAGFLGDGDLVKVVSASAATQAEAKP